MRAVSYGSRVALFVVKGWSGHTVGKAAASATTMPSKIFRST